MKEEIQGLIDKYYGWLKDKTVLKDIRDWVEITTPYLDRHNDYLQIYTKKTDGHYLLTDDGYIISDLELSGCKLDTPKRKELLNVTLNGFGVKKTDSDHLVVTATDDNFARRKHDLLQAMLAVNDLFYLASPHIKNLFIEDATRWFDENNILYTPKVKFSGISGFDYVFDFAIPKSGRLQKPERIIKAMANPSVDSAKSLILGWLETQPVRPADSEAMALLNDNERVSDTVVEALNNHKITPLYWTKRDDYKELLAA